MKTMEEYKAMNLPTSLQMCVRSCVRGGIDPDFVLDSDCSDRDKYNLLHAMSEGVSESDVRFVMSMHNTNVDMFKVLRAVRGGIDIKQVFKDGMTENQFNDACKEYRMSTAYAPNDERQKRALEIIATYRDEKTIPQLYQIYLGAYDGINPSIYADGYRADQMNAIRHGLKRGVDVSLALNPEYTAARMGEIVTAVEKGLDTKYAIDMRYDVDQVRVLQDALADGIDCSSFDDPSLNATRMRNLVFTAKAKAKGEEPLVIKETKNGLVMKNVETGEVVGSATKALNAF